MTATPLETSAVQIGFQPESSNRFSFERTTDMELVRAIMTIPDLYRRAADDLAGSPEDYTPPDHPSVWYILAHEGEELLGLWILMPENAICWDLHTRLLPSAYGPLSRLAMEALFGWIWKNTPCQRIVTKVPVFNRLAMALGKDVGMVEYGRNPQSFLKAGLLHEQVLLGVSAPNDKGEAT